MVLAHVPLGQYSLPVPLAATIGAALAVILASFVLIYLAPPRARDEPEGGPGAVRPEVTWALLAAGALLMAFIVLLSLFGPQRSTILNPGTLLFWTWIIPVVPLVHCFVGGMYEVANPLAAEARLISGGRRHPRAAEILSRIGYWPAVVQLLLLVIGESVGELVRAPLFLGLIGLAYVLFHIGMGVVLGEGWFAVGDLFQVFTSLASAIAPLNLRRERDGVVRLVRGFNPGRRLPRASGREAFITLWLAGVLADGVRQTPIWKRGIGLWTSPFFERIPPIGTVGDLDHFNLDVGAAVQVSVEVLFTWLAFAAFFWLFVLIAATLANPGEPGLPTRPALGRLAAVVSPSLVPIALAYLFAHNLSQLFVLGPLVVHVPADLGQATVFFNQNRAAASKGLIWFLQVFAIVLGHVIAVIMAHARLARAMEEPGGGAQQDVGQGRGAQREASAARILALRADLGWLSAMLIYTATSLWILAQPITGG
jgi:hypothetical protein